MHLRRTSTELVLFTLACALSLAACGATPTREVLAPTPGFAGFPSAPTDGSLWAEAFLHPNHAEILGTDLTEDGILPIALRLGRSAVEARRTSAAAGPRVSAATFNARLYLEDGTVLGWLPPTEPSAGGPVREAAARRGLELASLATWSEAETGFVFFRLERGMRVRGHRALTQRDDVYREVDLDHSLLAFEVESPGGPREVRVGLRADMLFGGSR